jgi:response regulator RpfG family c-di-GMP phosphodiesterase
MRQHPVIGEKIVASLRELRHLAPAIRSAHERWAGGGYPDGLRGEAIPIASRIVFACDAYDAMTSDRPYQAAVSDDEAREELLEHAGTQFDPEVIGPLIRILDAKRAPHPRTRSVSRFTAEGWISQALS